jgi:tetrapyrrole methylase family protein/MazG family protein
LARHTNKETADKFIELLEVLRRLRAPDGCPWDREQTAESLVPYLLEETYEIIEAIEEGDTQTLKEELGDLTLHILFQAELAREDGKFEIADSLHHISEKLIRRHPHVFDPDYDEDADINLSWERAKQKEKSRKNLLDGVPKNLPALTRARRIQEKAANVGFDWKDIQPVWEKVEEELKELKVEIRKNDPEKVKDEMGDVLFSLVNLSRFLDISPEDALRMTISKFEMRFAKVEKELKKKGKDFSDSSLEEMDGIWNDIKKEVI